MFSVVIPAYNESKVIGQTCRDISDTFATERITDFEILVIDDNSTDDTAAVLASLAASLPQLRYRLNELPNGFGFAVRCGLDHFAGDCACVVMADGSDDAGDIVRYYRAMAAGAECVFGSRFIAGSVVVRYPKLKLAINRVVNTGVRLLFGIPHNDLTNAFKCYRRDVVDGMRPFVSNHFNLTIELPLKAVTRGYSFVTLPVAWCNKRLGASNLSLREMGSRYLFIVLYIWLEKMLVHRDYERLAPGATRRRPKASSIGVTSTAQSTAVSRDRQDTN